MFFISRLVFIAGLVLSALPAAADKVSATPGSGTTLSAEFRPGNPRLPALVVLHGFLQTTEFQATRNVIEGLAGMGYTVLGPNLSLGVDDRRTSLPCEALHRHTLSEDVAEIDFWVNWLSQHGYQRIVFVGHSWGGQHALAYVQQHPGKPVMGIVAVSLVRARQSEQTLAAQADIASAMLHSATPGLKSYALNFCGKYVGTPESYLSYAAWTDARVIESLKGAGVPVYAILGGNDRRVDQRWMASLADAGAEVSVVDGADHFFSSQYEFDLVDAMQVALDALNAVH
jgi:pimeloyl-ACP methyl ester carboxylesterase